MTTIWLVDFDDTLASGPVTWGYQHALPKLINAHDLAVDDEALQKSLLVAQEHTNQANNLDAILDDFFRAMTWPDHLKQMLLDDVMENYRPELFEDALPFLQARRDRDQTTIILSNNPRMPVLARELELQQWVDDVVTPHMLPGASAKPSPSLWDRVVERFPMLTTENAVVVGDDPWSDVAFAESCGIRAWLIDRHDRFASLTLPDRATRVSSLLDIEV